MDSKYWILKNILKKKWSGRWESETTVHESWRWFPVFMGLASDRDLSAI